MAHWWTHNFSITLLTGWKDIFKSLSLLDLEQESKKCFYSLLAFYFYHYSLLLFLYYSQVHLKYFSTALKRSWKKENNTFFWINVKNYSIRNKRKGKSILLFNQSIGILFFTLKQNWDVYVSMYIYKRLGFKSGLCPNQ